jgi:acetyl-CoA acetyltransferase
MTIAPVTILGVGMSDLSRRDLTPEQMVHQVVTEALADAALAPGSLSLVLLGNALAGELCDQGCIRGQSWLRKTDIGSAGVINVDNSCAGGSSALHLATLAAAANDRPVLVVGVEKMWTGDRTATIAAIEQGLPGDYRADLHQQLLGPGNPGGSALMAVNASWARQYMEERGGTIHHIAAAAAKARRLAAANPLAQVQTSMTVEEVLAAPRVVDVLTRPMCSSFTDGAAALVLGGPHVPAGPPGAPPRPRIIGSVVRSGTGNLDYHERLEQAGADAWEAFGFGPDDVDLVELHDATSAEELFALESLGFFSPGEAGPATAAGRTDIGGDAVAVNPSGGLVGRGHPLGATGVAQVVELASQLQRRAGSRQVPEANLGVAVNSGGLIAGDAAFVGVHAVAAR